MNTLRANLLALLFAPLLGCADLATIGGLCVVDCVPPPPDAGRDACTGPSCEPPADAGSDACAADGCGENDAGPVCSQGTYELARMRADLMLVVDDSASLAPWLPALSDGLLQFLRSTPPDGLAVGLQRFDEVCEAEPYSVPLVPIAPLADNLPALLSALPFFGSLSTSTVPAFDGAHRYARAWAAANGDARVSVVLLTDVSPGACDGLIGDHVAEAQRIARAATEATPAIETYVVGFSTLPGPDSIAVAGGTQPTLISVAPPDGEVRLALENVRRSAQPCAFRWDRRWTPAPDAAVVVTAPDGSARRYPIHAASAACPMGDGFYVDDTTAAYPLVACAATCANLTPADRLALSSACSSQN